MRELERRVCETCGGVYHLELDGTRAVIFEDRLCMCEIEAEDLDDPNVIAASIIGQVAERPDRAADTDAD